MKLPARLGLTPRMVTPLPPSIYSARAARAQSSLPSFQALAIRRAFAVRCLRYARALSCVGLGRCQLKGFQELTDTAVQALF
jgi:hypothetical protein